MSSVGTYTYVTYNLKTSAIIDEIPLSQTSFNDSLNDIGSLSGNIPLSTDPENQRRNYVGSTQPARTGIIALRNDYPVWDGIIWTRKYDSQSKQFYIGANTLMSYFQHRYIVTTIDYNSSDAIYIASQLFKTAQSAANGNLGLIVDDTTLSGNKINFHIDYYQVLSVYDAFTQIFDSDPGFDWHIDTAIVGDNYVRNLRFSYPMRGVLADGVQPIVFDFPGNIVRYTWPEDGTEVRSDTIGVGSGSGPTMLIAEATAAEGTFGDYPLLEYIESMKQVTSEDTLKSKTTALQSAYADPIVLPTISVKADEDPVVGSYSVGDIVRVHIDDERFPSLIGQDIDTQMRIHDISFQPVDDGNPEMITLTLGELSTPSVGMML